jgi:hypothetical protein
MTKPRSKYERAIEVATDAFVEAILAGSSELMPLSGELMYEAIRLAGGVVLLDGEERVKRKVRDQVWNDISDRAQAKLEAHDLKLAAELVRESLQVLAP